MNFSFFIRILAEKDTHKQYLFLSINQSYLKLDIYANKRKSTDN